MKYCEHVLVSGCIGSLIGEQLAKLQSSKSFPCEKQTNSPPKIEIRYIQEDTMRLGVIILISENMSIKLQVLI